MQTESEGRRVHALAAAARERGEHLQSLQLSDQAILEYLKAGDLLGAAEGLADRSIVFHHLEQDYDNQVYLVFAKYELMLSVEIAKRSGQPEALALPLFNLGKIHEEIGDLEEAVKTYQQAVENMEQNPPQNHNRPAVLADFKIHLATCQYRAGDKNALERAEQATAELASIPTTSVADYEAQDNQLTPGTELSYNRDVWLSGAHMRIAEVLRSDNSSKAKEHLQKAKEIIDANPKLTIRAAQWEKLSESFN